MGRKNRNKIKKENDPSKNKQKQDEYAELLFAAAEDKKMKLKQEENDRLYVIWDTRREMLDYCDKMAIPLCDYMTIDIFKDFVEYLVEPR